MGIAVSRATVARKKMKQKIEPITFPISVYDKYLLKSSWRQLEAKQVEFGVGLFQSVFLKRPELINKFPEFKSMDDLEEMKSWHLLKGHPRKLSFAFNLAIDSIDDGLAFIEKIESIGYKHIDKMSDNDMELMGAAIIETVRDLTPAGLWTRDVEKAWKSLYSYICKLFKDSIEKAKSTTC
ncbi:globin-2 A chain-like [Rhopilema esculentum]|uniref:globin-2 A chain-like n=1 Tax=Rhopilema esculentum TaxID=499914 RepID=UPI0031DAC0E9